VVDKCHGVITDTPLRLAFRPPALYGAVPATVRRMFTGRMEGFTVSLSLSPPHAARVDAAGWVPCLRASGIIKGRARRW